MNQFLPWNNLSGKNGTAFTAAQLLATYSAGRISLSNSIWQEVQSEVKRSKYLKNLIASGQAFGPACKRGMGNSDMGPARERDGWQHSTGRASPFSLTSFKLWIHLLIYWRNSMDTNYIEDSWQKSFRRSNSQAQIQEWDLGNFNSYWDSRYSGGCLDQHIQFQR